MARPIAYDPATLRADLLSVFWSKGFAETSLADIEDATRLNRRQLYNVFGDKRDMFLQALDDFSDQAGRQFLGALEKEDAGVTDIKALLDTFVELAASDDDVRSCMVCNVSREAIATDKNVKQRIDAYFDRITAAYRNALTQAAARGEATFSEVEIESRTSRLFATHIALCILGKAKRPQAELRRLVDEAVSGLT